MKTVEFKLDLTKEQQARIDKWLDSLPWVWNCGLALLEWRQYWLRYQKCLKRPENDVEISQEVLDRWGFTNLPKELPSSDDIWEFEQTSSSDNQSNNDWQSVGIPLVPIRQHKNNLRIVHKRTKKGIETKEVVVWGLCCDRTIYKKLEGDEPPLSEWQFEEERENKRKEVQKYRHTWGTYRLSKRHWAKTPPINSYDYKQVRGYFTQKNHPDFPEFNDIPSKFVAGCCRSLINAWEMYMKSERGRPHYKNKNNPVVTLMDVNCAEREKLTDEQKADTKRIKEDIKALKEEAKKNKTKLDKLPEIKKAPLVNSTIKVINNSINIHKLGRINVKGLQQRWGVKIVAALKVTKTASGYYLQLTGEVDPTKLKLSDRAIGLDAGVTNTLTDDKGRQIKPQQFYRKLETHLARLQRQIAKKKDGSKNQQKAREKLARAHEKIKRRRRAFNHKLSTKIVREYGAIAVEDLKLKNMTASPKAKRNEDGLTYAKNGAKRKAGLNKSILDAGIGQLFELIEQKVQAANPDGKLFGKDCLREFTRVDPKYTSQTCNACKHVESGNRLTQAKFECLKCGHTDHADANAAKNVLVRGLSVFERSYRSWEWMKPVESERSASRTLKQEALVATKCDSMARREKSRHPTPNSSRNEIQDKICADTEVLTKDIAQEQPETALQSAKRKRSAGQGIRAKPKTLAPPETCDDSSPPASQRSTIKGQAKDRSTQPKRPIQLELDLWGTTPEITA